MTRGRSVLNKVWLLKCFQRIPAKLIRSCHSKSEIIIENVLSNAYNILLTNVSDVQDNLTTRRRGVDWMSIFAPAVDLNSSALGFGTVGRSRSCSSYAVKDKGHPNKAIWMSPLYKTLSACARHGPTFSWGSKRSVPPLHPFIHRSRVRLG